MTTIVWPSGYSPKEWEFGLKYNTQISVSDLSGYVQTVELPGFRWTISLRMPGMARADGGATFEAFIAKLRGQANRAQVPVFRRSASRGTWGTSPSAPKVNNEVGSPTLSQTGTTLQISNVSPFGTWKEGDYFNLGAGGQLLMVTADGQADSNGTGVVSLNTAIRSAPAHNLALVINNPVVPLMIVTDPYQKFGETADDDATNFSFDFVEVFA